MNDSSKIQHVKRTIYTNPIPPKDSNMGAAFTTPIQFTSVSGTAAGSSIVPTARFTRSAFFIIDTPWRAYKMLLGYRIKTARTTK